MVRRIDETKALGGFAPDTSERRTDDLHFVRAEEQCIASFCAGGFLQCIQIAGREKLQKRGLGAFGLEENVRQTFCLQFACERRPGIDLASGKLSAAGHADRADNPGLERKRLLEHFESAAFADRRNIDNRKIESQIWLVRSVRVHHMLPRERFDFAPFEFLRTAFTENFFDGSLDDGLHVGLLAETHLEVELQKFWLTIATQIFITETACDLEIAIESADHTELLQLLRTLRQNEEISGVHARGDDVFARTFGRSFDETRRIDLQTTLLREVRTNDLEDFGTQCDVALHLSSAKIQVAILQTQFFIYKRCGILP